MNNAMLFTPYANSLDHSISQHIQNAAYQASVQCESHFIKILKSLSKQNKWIFITANTAMPSSEILMLHGIELSRLIRLKASHHLNELETIEKAKKSGTASAIISNANCYYFSEGEWLTLNRNKALLH